MARLEAMQQGVVGVAFEWGSWGVWREGGDATLRVLASVNLASGGTLLRGYSRISLHPQNIRGKVVTTPALVGQ